MRGISSFSELEPNNLPHELVIFIESELKNFPSSNEFLDILEKKKNENQHSLSFCLYMTNICKSKFYFGRENAQKGSSVIDIGIYYGSCLIFTIEAKLLPTPKGTKSSPRVEHEYVYGKGGGIQRFKEGRHGLDNTDNYLSENGLIAFIKEENFEFWFVKINQWILDASWNPAERLQKEYFRSTAKLQSGHSRKDDSFVILHHFWVYVESV